MFGSASVESTALMSKADNKEKCLTCGFKWHPPDKCWENIGYPTWHYKYKQNQQKNKGKSVVKSGTTQQKRTAATAESTVGSTVASTGHIMFTLKQFEQLMRSLPHFANQAETSHANDTDEELENEYVAGISWYTCLNSSKLLFMGG